ncbi:hypothetical protein NDU88_007079 [Pleurodeles waltl]|uniref:Uncharacterized protein n=1 Tax=Pleurodeles waltl TaxID=8319 RepID=A0AAV7RRB5_PLEWA|nr:hypothetical protein NDU88_007079 [Pleurodeles waltl]
MPDIRKRQRQAAQLKLRRGEPFMLRTGYLNSSGCRCACRSAFPCHRTRSGAAHTRLYFMVRGSFPRYEREECRTFENGNGRQHS